MSLSVEDHAVIGDTQTAALVGRDGTVDWLCLPRVDSGAIFAALLGTEEHGRWCSLRPVGRGRSGAATATRRGYWRPSSTPSGWSTSRRHAAMRLTWSASSKGCGRVPMRMDLRLRLNYGHIVRLWWWRVGRGL